MKDFIRTFSLLTAALLLFSQCETEESIAAEPTEPQRTVETRECFDYVYPFTVIMEGETIGVQSFDQYAQLHIRCQVIANENTQGDPKGRDDSSTPTGKGGSNSSSDYGDCPRDKDPWCGEIIFPVTITNIPNIEGEVVVPNDSTLQYYRWVICD